MGYHGRNFCAKSKISVLKEEQLFSKVPKWYKKNSLKKLQTTAYKQPQEVCKFKPEKGRGSDSPLSCMDKSVLNPLVVFFSLTVLRLVYPIHHTISQCLESGIFPS